MRRGAAAAARRIKVSQGARKSSWPGRWEALCSDSGIWRGVGVGVRAARGAARGHNKGLARHPQEFLAWEMGNWEGMGYGGMWYVGMEV